jgi:hypothetical protein
MVGITSGRLLLTKFKKEITIIFNLKRLYSKEWLSTHGRRIRAGSGGGRYVSSESNIQNDHSSSRLQSIYLKIPNFFAASNNGLKYALTDFF